MIFVAFVKPANAFVYIPSTSECLSISSNDGHKGQKGCHQTLDANLLSPLFLQFFAWKNLMRLNKEIKDTMETGTDVNKMNVLGLIKNASENTLISMQRNTISKNTFFFHLSKLHTFSHSLLLTNYHTCMQHIWNCFTLHLTLC